MENQEELELNEDQVAQLQELKRVLDEDVAGLAEEMKLLREQIRGGEVDRDEGIRQMDALRGELITASAPLRGRVQEILTVDQHTRLQPMVRQGRPGVGRGGAPRWRPGSRLPAEGAVAVWGPGPAPRRPGARGGVSARVSRPVDRVWLPGSGATSGARDRPGSTAHQLHSGCTGGGFPKDRETVGTFHRFCSYIELGAGSVRHSLARCREGEGRHPLKPSGCPRFVRVSTRITFFRV